MSGRYRFVITADNWISFLRFSVTVLRFNMRMLVHYREYDGLRDLTFLTIMHDLNRIRMENVI